MKNLAKTHQKYLETKKLFCTVHGSPHIWRLMRLESSKTRLKHVEYPTQWQAICIRPRGGSGSTQNNTKMLQTQAETRTNNHDTDSVAASVLPNAKHHRSKNKRGVSWIYKITIRDPHDKTGQWYSVSPLKRRRKTLQYYYTAFTWPSTIYFTVMLLRFIK